MTMKKIVIMSFALVALFISGCATRTERSGAMAALIAEAQQVQLFENSDKNFDELVDKVITDYMPADAEKVFKDWSFRGDISTFGEVVCTVSLKMKGNPPSVVTLFMLPVSIRDGKAEFHADRMYVTDSVTGMRQRLEYTIKHI